MNSSSEAQQMNLSNAKVNGYVSDIDTIRETEYPMLRGIQPVRMAD